MRTVGQLLGDFNKLHLDATSGHAPNWQSSTERTRWIFSIIGVIDHLRQIFH